MTLHISIRDVVERCIGTESPLAIFKANQPHHGNYHFNVLFADTVQTQHDIKKNRGFIQKREKPRLFRAGMNSAAVITALC